MLMFWNKSLSVAALIGAVSLVSPSLAASRVTTAPSPQTRSTASYVLKLSVGMAEKMWTPAQVRAKHPTTGEVMLRGSMTGAMSMGGSQRHVEVHITSRTTSKVVTGAHPTISAVDTNVKNAMAIKVPVAVMQGVMTGAADLHYGNNVDLVAGHLYKITIVLNGERAVFEMRAPKA